GAGASAAAPARRRDDLLAAARGREARADRQRPAAPAGQPDALLLPVAARLLQPDRGHRRDAEAAARPRRAALLRDLPAVLPDVLHVVHRQAEPGRLDAALDRSPRDPVPAGRLPPLLPVLPRAQAAELASLADPRRLPARDDA